MSRTRTGPPLGAIIFVRTPAMGTAIADIDRAKFTQRASTGLLLSPILLAVPPLRTDCVRIWQLLMFSSLTRNSAIPPMYAGERLSRKTAESDVREYFPFSLIRNP